MIVIQFIDNHPFLSFWIILFTYQLLGVIVGVTGETLVGIAKALGRK